MNPPKLTAKHHGVKYFVFEEFQVDGSVLYRASTDSGMSAQNLYSMKSAIGYCQMWAKANLMWYTASGELL